MQDEITGGLFVGPEVTIIIPHDLSDSAPFESLATILTLNVPVVEYVCEAELEPPVELEPSPQNTVTATESPSGSETP